MNRLIINADDFGIHSDVNKAIASAYDNGILTSTSLLANGPAFEEALSIARERPKLGLSIHLCLVGSLPPVSPVESVPTLVDERGLFPESYVEFMKRLYSGHIRMEEVYTELNRQMAKIMELGLPVTHIDSHQHLHVLPPVWQMVKSLMKQYGIHRLRIPAESYGFKVLLANPVRMMGRNGPTLLAKKARREARHLGFTTTDYFWGMVDGGNMNERNLAYIVGQLPFGVHEIMVHPGLHTALLSQTFTWGYHWQDEWHALVSPAMRERIRKHNIELISYGDLP